MKSQLSAIAILILAPSLATGQEKQGSAPKPRPEVQKLGYYVGTWEGHGESKAGPFGPAGKLSSKMTCGWFTGGFQIVCRGEETGPTGTRGFLNILSYDEKAKAYTQYAISSLGESEYSQGGCLVGNTLTYRISQVVDGKPVKFRYTEAHVSPALMTYRAEAAPGGAPWKLIAEGKIAKVK